jgi:uncharacterized protein (TIGR03083 family)
MRLAGEEYQRLLRVLRSLTAPEWEQPTTCTDWNVRQMVGHVLGAAELAASPLEQRRQLRAAHARGGVLIDALTAVQVSEREHLAPEELMERFDRAAPRAVRGRRMVPGLVRRREMPDQQVVGDHPEPWTIGYLLDVILTRDTWMHRMDVCQATGRQPVLTADHDGVLVADIAQEWAARHGQPCTLTLTGQAGGTWAWGSGGPALEMDAVEFCRVLSGRGQGEGLLAQAVPF